MHTGNGSVTELILVDGCRYARLTCPENLIPAPGQYLLASDGSDSLLPVPIFYTDSAPGGFISTASEQWTPGDVLYLRGPLGRGFTLPTSARKVGLVAFDDVPARLRALIPPALRQDASIVLVCDSNVDDLHNEVEIQPLSALEEILKWAEFIAIDVDRKNMPQLLERLERHYQLSAVREAQILIRTPMPCGGVADCGVCAVVTKSGWQMACKDGPVFDLNNLRSPMWGPHWGAPRRAE
jgi:dihydroorotate dehydrogenase electron transfer subunit